MLYFLTGDVQTGKTRWLEQAVEALRWQGVGVSGVVAPGVWRTRDGAFEKLGIDNVLLPSGERVRFARKSGSVGMHDGAASQRRPSRAASGRSPDGSSACSGPGPSESGSSQSARAGLGWDIDDAAIERVDAHFAALAASAAAWSGPAARALLVVDELGRLELECSGGLVNAVSLLGRGASLAFPHALVVVRAGLLDAARERFASAPWGGMRALHPDEDSLGEISARLSALPPLAARQGAARMPCGSLIPSCSRRRGAAPPG